MTCIPMNRSPACPPCLPTLPMERSLSVLPLSTPAGILTSMLRRVGVQPSPLHLQGGQAEGWGGFTCG